MDYLNMIALLCLNFSIACFLTAFYVNAYNKECLKEDVNQLLNKGE